MIVFSLRHYAVHGHTPSVIVFSGIEHPGKQIPYRIKKPKLYPTTYCRTCALIKKLMFFISNWLLPLFVPNPPL
jgi:hypothetical protein